MNRRSAQRFRLAWPVEFGNDHRGVTRDISTRGVYIEADRTFLVGERIEFAVIMTRANSADAGKLRCVGVVVRADGGGPQFGIGVNFTDLAFLPDSPTATS